VYQFTDIITFAQWSNFFDTFTQSCALTSLFIFLNITFSGCDGDTYASECNAHGAGVSVSYTGECGTTSVTGITDAPVTAPVITEPPVAGSVDTHAPVDNSIHSKSGKSKAKKESKATKTVHHEKESKATKTVHHEKESKATKTVHHEKESKGSKEVHGPNFSMQQMMGSEDASFANSRHRFYGWQLDGFDV
jgi:hypothetical protein